jgi:hypothetical protein
MTHWWWQFLVFLKFNFVFINALLTSAIQGYRIKQGKEEK